MVDDLNPRNFHPKIPEGENKRIPLPTPPRPLTLPSGLKAPSLPPPPITPKKGMPAPSLRPPLLPGRKEAPQMDSSARAVEERLKKMEDQSRELEESKKKLERSLAEMELKLKEEKEKALSQTIKAREEESLSLKMEQALKEMQEKARRDRREQELEENRLRAEEKAKELERRLNEEREAWMMNLKKQMELRDSETNQVESQMTVRFRELERRWLEEKSMLAQALKSKEDELIQLRATLQEFQTHIRRSQEDSAHAIELAKKKFEGELETKEKEVTQEKRSLAEKLEMRERELVSLKAQLAMIDAQVRAAQESSLRNLQEKERAWQSQLSDLQKDLNSLKQVKEQLQTDLNKTNAEKIAQESSLRNLQEKERAWQSQLPDLQKDLNSLKQVKEQLQTDLNRSVAENHAIKETMGALKQDLEKRQEQVNQKTQELKFALSHTEIKVQESVLVKDRLQAELARANADVVSLKRDLNELEKRQNLSEQRNQELKFALSQMEIKTQETMLKLKDELHRKSQDYETLEKNYFNERQIWANKLEERNISERSLREILTDREKNLATLTGERSELERRLEIEFENEKRLLTDQYQKIIIKHENEVADLKLKLNSNEVSDLKLKLNSIEDELKSKFNKEKKELQKEAEGRLQENISLKIKWMVEDLSQIRELASNDLADLENRIQEDQLQHQAQLNQKEAELSDTLHAMKELQKEFLEEKSRTENELKVMQEQIVLELKKERESHEVEKKKWLELIHQEGERRKEEMIEETSLLSALKEQFQNEKNLLEQELGAYKSMVESQQKVSECSPGSIAHFLKKSWQYLTRPVIILNLRASPRIRRVKEGEPLP